MWVLVCWFSTLLRDVFLRVLQIPPLLFITTIVIINYQRNSFDFRSFRSCYQEISSIQPLIRAGQVRMRAKVFPLPFAVINGTLNVSVSGNTAKI